MTLFLLIPWGRHVDVHQLRAALCVWCLDSPAIMVPCCCRYGVPIVYTFNYTGEGPGAGHSLTHSLSDGDAISNTHTGHTVGEAAE